MTLFLVLFCLILWAGIGFVIFGDVFEALDFEYNYKGVTEKQILFLVLVCGPLMWAIGMIAYIWDFVGNSSKETEDA